jgi:hypothetical protein
MPGHPLLDDDNDDEEHEPYIEPDIEAGEWPEEWTPKQRQNWRDHALSVYRELETDWGRYWYRRTWRPKKRGDGMMQDDHVKLGTPEDYVTENVEDYLRPMGDMTSVMMRQISRYTVDKDDLDNAVEDIVQAKIATMGERQQQRLLEQSQRVAEIYGGDS